MGAEFSIYRRSLLRVMRELLPARPSFNTFAVSRKRSMRKRQFIWVRKAKKLGAS